MPEFELRGDGPSSVSVDENGTATVTSEHPMSVSPSLPITDIRINILELVSIALSREGAKRIIRGNYADGGSFEVSVDAEAGKFEAKGMEVLSQLANGDDQSHSVLTYLPRVRHVKKATH
jgi:hypothetical protein